MTESEYADMFRTLCSEHYDRNISLVEYRTRRKQILDMMDNEYSDGGTSSTDDDETQKQWPRTKSGDHAN